MTRVISLSGLMNPINLMRELLNLQPHQSFKIDIQSLDPESFTALKEEKWAQEF